ncbi:ankyrin repeat-containing domain protein [Coprinopsis sp. MPI-PUGE-AT-0042]|nr:ankyrin repeat-containing domain protein [Coprinopsis sp. MPI-PUGE-AT-0042]
MQRDVSPGLAPASLQLDALRGCASVYAVERTLEDFPCQIEEVYRQTWKRIKEQPPDMFIVARSALIWVLCAMRSLKIEELRHAVATCPDTHKFDCRRLVDKATLMGLCRGLVSIEEETNIVRFVHYTAKDIVQGLVSESFPYLDSLPASVCMAILAEPRFQQPALDDTGALMDALETETLLAYAYEHWSIHARKSLDNMTLFGLLSQFIQGCCAFPVGLLGGLPWLVNILEPIHMAAYFNFPLSVVDTNHPTPHKGRTPLTLATWKNSLGAMSELLSLPNILVNAADKDGDIPLTYAGGWHKKGSLPLLLAHPKINFNASNAYGVTALMRASSEEKAILLLTHPKIKPNLVNCNGVTALMYVSRSGSLKVVKALLADLRVQVNLKSKAGKTALDMAEEGKFARYHSVDQRRRCEEVAELLRAHSQHEHPQLHPLKVLLRHAQPFSRKR